MPMEPSTTPELERGLTNVLNRVALVSALLDSLLTASLDLELAVRLEGELGGHVFVFGLQLPLISLTIILNKIRRESA